MILESSLILQIIPPKNPGVSFNQGRIPRSEPIGADLACRLLDFRTWLPVTRHSLDGHTPGWSNKPSVSNLPVKNDCKVGPKNYFENMVYSFWVSSRFSFWVVKGGDPLNISPARWDPKLTWGPYKWPKINGLGDRCLQPYRNWGEFSPQENMSLTLKGEKSFFLDWSSLFPNQFFWLGKSRGKSYVKGHTDFVLETIKTDCPLNMGQRNVLANPRFNRHHFGLN